MKNILKELFEVDTLLKEFRKLKAEHVAAVLTGIPQESLVRIESELTRLQSSIHARDSYTNPRRLINWN